MTALEIIKQEQRGRQSLVLVIGDQAAQQVMIAWTFYETKPCDYAPKKTETHADMWRNLWAKSLPIDYEELSRVSNVPRTHCEKIFYRLRVAKLIYPDGTIPQPVSELIDGLMLARVRGTISKRKLV